MRRRKYRAASGGAQREAWDREHAAGTRLLTTLFNAWPGPPEAFAYAAGVLGYDVEQVCAALDTSDQAIADAVDEGARVMFVEDVALEEAA